VVISRQTSEFAERVLPVVRRRASALNAPLWCAWETCPVVAAGETSTGQAVTFRLPDGSQHAAHLPLHGAFQRGNLEAALTAVWLLVNGGNDSVTPRDLGSRLAQGVAACRWPGRLEVNRAPTGQTLVLDGAHCPLSAAAVARTVGDWQAASILPERGPIEILWGMQRDKQHREFLAALTSSESHPFFGAIHAYRVTGVRGAEAESLAAVAREMGLSAHSYNSPQAALRAAAQTGRNVLAVGTLYTLAELREHWGRRFAAT
jgi:folylpolyglutamate synthase/dihydropteroate synthase